MKKKIGFVSLGCAKNLTDTETMLALLQNDNYIITSDADDADAVAYTHLASAERERLGM